MPFLLSQGSSARDVDFNPATWPQNASNADAALGSWMGGPPWPGGPAVLATMHGKQQAITPVVARFLGLEVGVAPGLDTDAFGTFSREVERIGTPLDAARGKIAAGFNLAPGARFGLASEGSFGPHPSLPFLPIGREIVVLIDRASGLELVGQHVSANTNFAHAIVDDSVAGRVFGEQIGFPGHGLIVTASVDGRPAPHVALMKDMEDWNALACAIERVVGLTGAALVETDMRAHRNPRRMRAIRRATLDLVRRSRIGCPVCGRPGYSVTERLPGLPCADCGEPTLQIRAERRTCAGCSHGQERAVPERAADPGRCGYCNP